MKPFWLSAFVAVIVAAFLAVPSAAQKGKGGGNGKGAGKDGNFTPPGKSSAQPSGPGHSEPARPFDHPNSGNNLSKETGDKLPPGLRDMPEKQPGAAHHLQKLDDDKARV